MNIYPFVITEKLQRTVCISANSEDEALEIVTDRYNNEEIVLDYDDIVSYEISTEED